MGWVQSRAEPNEEGQAGTSQCLKRQQSSKHWISVSKDDEVRVRVGTSNMGSTCWKGAAEPRAELKSKKMAPVNWLKEPDEQADRPGRQRGPDGRRFYVFYRRAGTKPSMASQGRVLVVSVHVEVGRQSRLSSRSYSLLIKQCDELDGASTQFQLQMMFEVR